MLNSTPSQAIDVLVMRSSDGRWYRAAVTDVVSGAQPSQARLVFTHKNGHAVLSEVWQAGKPAGSRLRQRTETAGNDTNVMTLMASADLH